MVKRYCPKCNAEFDRKSSYEKHINKKFDCRPIKEENKKICKNLQELAEICKEEEKDAKNKEMNVCYYCKRNYSSKYTLSRHLEIGCKIKKEEDDEKENIFKLLLEKEKQHKEEVKELKKQNKLLMEKIEKLINLKDNSKTTNNISNSNSNNQINSNNTLNTQNNLIINYGKEDLDIIDKQIFLDRVIKKNINGVQIPDEILKIIHFNPMYPQLSNIYISDINREKCMIYENGEWKLTPTDKIPEIIDKVITFSNNTDRFFRDKHPNNKKLKERLNVIKKYNDMNDNNYIEELKDNMEENIDLIKRCENFQKKTYQTFKTTLYNEGKNIKKTIVKN